MKIDHTKYKIWNKRSLSMIHFMLNPGMAFIELILGMRIPKIILIDKNSDEAFINRITYPCPHCETYHHGNTWSFPNKTIFKNWFGLYCRICGKIIPCVRNWTSGLILILTYPLWFWWINSWKQSWLSKQPARYSKLIFERKAIKKYLWIKVGLLFGFTMLITLFIPIYIRSNYRVNILLIGILYCVISGLFFGYAIKWWSERRPKNHS
ncbi:MAG: hypothetical protein JXR10_09880 [Cyclobacteriaceae bacterium]